MSEHELFPEAELRELFRPRRPEPTAFRAGIERRLAERREREVAVRNAGEGEDDGSAAPLRSLFLRRVAALLPSDPLTGAAAGSITGKWVGVKLLPTALALPALVLGAAVGGFVAGLRSLRHSARRAVPHAVPHVEPGRAGRGPRAHWTLTLISLLAPLLILAPGLLGSNRMADVLVGVLLLSMVGLALSARGLARAGMLSRATIADLCSGLLAMLMSSVFLWATLPSGAIHGGSGASAGLVVLLLGFAGCRLLAPKGRGGRWGTLAPFFLLAPLVFGLTNPLGLMRTSPDSLRAQLAGLELDAFDLQGWQEAGALHQAMSAVGIEPPDLAPVAREIERALEPPPMREGEKEPSVHPAVWTAAADMGLVSREQWRRLAQHRLEAYALERLVVAQPAAAAHLQPWQRYQIAMLLATRELNPEAHANVVGNVESNWPELGTHAALERAWMVVSLLDALGEAPRVEALRPRVHELLRRYWIPQGGASLFGAPGGFTSDPAKFRTSFRDSTFAAVQLMVRLGVPAGIELSELQAHLRRAARADATFFDRADYLKAYERAALVLLEERIGLPDRGAFERVLDERLLVATLLIVALCLTAVVLVPRAGALGAGARP